MIAVIGEKPSVARDIARILGASEKQDGYLSGNGYLVTWAFGHLVGLAMPEAVISHRTCSRKSRNVLLIWNSTPALPGMQPG